MGEPNSIRAILQGLIEGRYLSVEGLVAEAGISSATLYAWASGRRNPSPENLARLADALEARGEGLKGIAEELRKASR